MTGLPPGAAYEWWPVSRLTDPAPSVHLVEVYRDCWWTANAKGEVLVYRSGGRRPTLHPQCNSNKIIAERVGLRVEGAVEMVQVPLALIPRSAWEYAE